MVLKPAEIRNMSKPEIQNKIFSLKEELYKLRYEGKTGRIEKPHRIKQLKREVARLLTISQELGNAAK